jgi:NAD(P)-dependent dehydrogenase (short-subunit alcohol dehydrogenase family)
VLPARWVSRSPSRAASLARAFSPQVWTSPAVSSDGRGPGSAASDQRRKIIAISDALAEYRRSGKLRMVPAYAAGDERAGMFFEMDYYANPARGAVKEWSNQMAESSWLSFDGLAPAPSATTPTLLVHSDGCVLPDNAKAVYARNSKQLRYRGEIVRGQVGTNPSVAVVTGANRGIGQEIAKQLAARGVRVLAAAREVGAGDVVLDVTSMDQIDALADRLRDGLDILINNAGVSLDGFSDEIARRTLAVNFYGAMNVTDRLLPSMRAGGRIVMVSSGMGELSIVAPHLRTELDSPNLNRRGLIELMESFISDVANGVHRDKGWPSNAYAVSKLGLNALTRVLARELAGDRRAIIVNAACPGWVHTRMGGRGAPRSPKEGARTPVWLALLPAGSPSGGFFRDEHPIAW